MKIPLLLLFSIGVFLIHSWWAMGAFVLVVVATVIIARLPIGTFNRMLVPVYVLAAFSVLFNVLPTPSFETLFTGLFFGLRMIVLVAASFVVCLTSSSRELLMSFSWYINPLRNLHVPVDDIALTLALSLRFIPLIEQEFETVRAAQKSRGAELTGSPINKLRIWGAAFAAVFVGLFRHADNLATAMDSRCYGLGR